ncbi:hypothetical protein [Streptosporangium sp. CA-115845]|uniref:hypothetical protein n=1 Tax=Streptosporangium sp. CA-115845 TaxID=3240071 RepID=UPI003D89EA5D
MATTVVLLADLKAQALTEIGRGVFAGLTVEAATEAAGTTAKTAALTEGWDAEAAAGLAAFVTAIGTKWSADLLATHTSR